MERSAILLVFATAIGLAASSTQAAAQERKAVEITRPAGVPPFVGVSAELETLGAKLFADENLSTNKMSCNTCHADFGSYSEGFKSAYPHRMGMAVDMFGVEKVDAEQAVQACMLLPMEAKILGWQSRELAALTAYVLKVQKEYVARK